MAEYYGTELQIAIQAKMRERQSWIETTPEIANGGRVLNFLEPEKIGWDLIQRLFAEDRVISFTAQPLDTMMPLLRDTFGEGCRYPYWNVFVGDSQTVCSASKSIVENVRVPSGWKLQSLERPTDDQISAVQKLNIATGIAPYPAFYSRGEVVPCLTTCLWNCEGSLVGTASANYRYHRDSRFSRYVFEGSVSVSGECRGLGLGKLLNAAVLLDSHELYGWTGVLAQARPDNAPSRRMIEACGLAMSPDLVTISVIASKEEFTR
jgi:hypothetical protein